ncbi:MAG: nucleotide exchange factor GrpE [Bacteroidetes bacterium]|nr:nucleotide exchange factor GrpE [Bacteroidota bacterium]
MTEQTTENVQNEQPAEPQAADTAPQKSELETANETIASLRDQLLRKAAEFDNFKRRAEQNQMTFAKYASENVILGLLPVVDDLSRSLKSGREKLENDPFYKGVELILNKFTKLLEAQGVKPIESVGKEFNVEYHDVMMQVPRTDVPANTIIEEIETGYFLFDKVIRHAKVIVASAAEGETKN